MIQLRGSFENLQIGIAEIMRSLLRMLKSKMANYTLTRSSRSLKAPAQRLLKLCTRPLRLDTLDWRKPYSTCRSLTTGPICIERLVDICTDFASHVSAASNIGCISVYSQQSP